MTRSARVDSTGQGVAPSPGTARAKPTASGADTATEPRKGESLALKHMHVHVVRGFYRLFWPAYDGTWEAEAHFKLALAKLEEHKLDQMLDLREATSCPQQ